VYKRHCLEVEILEEKKTFFFLNAKASKVRERVKSGAAGRCHSRVKNIT